MKKIKPFNPISFLKTFPYSYYSQKRREQNEQVEDDFLKIELSVLINSQNLASSIDPSLELFTQCERTLSDGAMKKIQFVGSDLILTLDSIDREYEDRVDVDVKFENAILKCYKNNQKMKLPLNQEKQKNIILSTFAEVHHINFQKKNNQYYFHIYNGSDLIIQCSHITFYPHQDYNHPMMKIHKEKNQLDSSLNKNRQSSTKVNKL
jgi:hypothetical protein